MLYHGTYAQIVRESRKRSPPCSRRHRLDINSGLCSGKERTNGGKNNSKKTLAKNNDSTHGDEAWSQANKA